MANKKISQLDSIGSIDVNQDSIPIVDYSENTTKRTNLANIGQRVLEASSTTNLSTLTSHTSNTSNPHATTKAQVGLSNVADVDTTNASNIASGTLSDSRLSSAVTTQGNTFNGVSQLVKLDASAKLPAVDGSNLTNLPISPSTGGDLYLFYNY